MNVIVLGLLILIEIVMLYVLIKLIRDGGFKKGIVYSIDFKNRKITKIDKNFNSKV